ncbi:MAG: hypothetical protein J6O55_00555 [Lachnospiraceae bacterium]|nr:hypothetical protein [Lachnospiraceae bacterium]
MPRGVAKEPLEPSILDVFDFIPKTDKNRFTRFAKNLGISQEELLKLAIKGTSKGKLPVQKKVIIDLDDDEE